MMGWAMFAALALGAGVLLWVTGFPRKLWTVAATAMMLGAAGYAWQGNPGLSGHPVSAEAHAVALDQQLIDLRDAMFGKFGTYAWQYASIADGLARAGKSDQVAAIYAGAVRKSPGDTALWTALGYALAERDGQISPAAKLAFDRALMLAPEHPGPAYFLGLAQAREGKLVEAREWLARAVERTPEGASYRATLAMQLVRLDLLLIELGRMKAPPAAGQEGR